MAIGVAMANPGREVVVWMRWRIHVQHQELETIRRLQLPIKFFVNEQRWLFFDSGIAKGLFRRSETGFRQKQWPDRSQSDSSGSVLWIEFDCDQESGESSRGDSPGSGHERTGSVRRKCAAG